MSEDGVTRWATITRQPSSDVDGTHGDYVSDSGFTAVTLERPWANNEANVSCIEPAPLSPALRYLALWQWSHAHGCNVYHLQNVDGHTEIELHAANVIDQLKGCIAFGMAVEEFGAGSIHPGIPAVCRRGITESVLALAKLEADMRDVDGEQQSFWLTIQ